MLEVYELWLVANLEVKKQDDTKEKNIIEQRKLNHIAKNNLFLD